MPFNKPSSRPVSRAMGNLPTSKPTGKLQKKPKQTFSKREIVEKKENAKKVFQSISKIYKKLSYDYGSLVAIKAQINRYRSNVNLRPFLSLNERIEFDSQYLNCRFFLLYRETSIAVSGLCGSLNKNASIIGTKIVELKGLIREAGLLLQRKNLIPNMRSHIKTMADFYKSTLDVLVKNEYQLLAERVERVKQLFVQQKMPFKVKSLRVKPEISMGRVLDESSFNGIDFEIKSENGFINTTLIKFYKDLKGKMTIGAENVSGPMEALRSVVLRNYFATIAIKADRLIDAGKKKQGLQMYLKYYPEVMKYRHDMRFESESRKMSFSYANSILWYVGIKGVKLSRKVNLEPFVRMLKLVKWDVNLLDTLSRYLYKINRKAEGKQFVMKAVGLYKHNRKIFPDSDWKGAAEEYRIITALLKLYSLKNVKFER